MKDFSRLGIRVKDGVMTLNGRPYHGVGVNFFPALSLCLAGSCTATQGPMSRIT